MAKISVSDIEYEDGGKAIWVHSPNGTTPMRVQCAGNIRVAYTTRGAPFIDVLVGGDIVVCLPKKKKKT